MKRMGDVIREAITSKDSIVCCGLDPDVRKFPTEYQNHSACVAIEKFLRRVIDITLPNVAAYKIQKAYFDMYAGGHQVLSDTIAYIRSLDPGIPVIVDCKIGDIDNTMKAYFHMAFAEFGADAVTLNPYMGGDVWSLLKNFPGRAGIVLIKTSNQGGRIIQNALLRDGHPLWRYLLDILINEWKHGLCLIPALSDHDGTELVGIRSSLPSDMPVFYAGAGVQGANLNSLRYVFDSHGCGVLVNSSRALLYPYAPSDPAWASGIEKACIDLKRQLNVFRL